MTQKLTSLALLAVIVVAALIGYRLVQARIAAEVYRDRLADLADDYEALRANYNKAVTRTAVTELLVENGEVCVAVRRADGQVHRVPTPYKAGSQVYADYVVIDGRLWVRRVFDDATAPQKGVVIDPALADIDWDAPAVAVGKAVSRKLTEGRWVVTVTGDGSLGLAKTDRESDLTAAPPLGRFEPVTKTADADAQQIGAKDVLRQLTSGE